MSSSSLAASSLLQVTNHLKSDGSSLQGEHEYAIAALLAALEQGLNGDLSPHYHLSSIDPGIGKSLSVAMFLKVWKARAFKPASSVLIGLSRLQEIQGYLEKAGLDKGDVAVLTSNPEFNDLGLPRERHGSARVMFTTQQMIERRTRDRTFADVAEFHFEGKPRTLRIWDESLIPAAHLVLNGDELGRLPFILRKRWPELAKEVQDLMIRLFPRQEHERVLIPASFAELPDGIRSIKDISAMETLETLARLAGQQLEVTMHGGAVQLPGAARPLPADFAPVVILDASGRVRSTYRLWEEAGGPLRRLPAATKDYSNLRVHLWERRIGKDAIKLHAVVDEVASAICGLIDEDQTDDHWLVISYKEPSIEPSLRKLLDASIGYRVNFLTWGMHHGTNEFKGCRKVVMVGQLSYGTAGYRALAAACGASDRSEVALDELRRGEYRHHLLQALTRASVRNNRDGRSGACTAYLVASPNLQMAELIVETFPECAIERWPPESTDVGGKVGELISLLNAAKSRGEHRVRKRDVRTALCINAPNFSRLLRHPELLSWLEQNHAQVEHTAILFSVGFIAYPGGGFTIDQESDCRDRANLENQ